MPESRGSFEFQLWAGGPLIDSEVTLGILGLCPVHRGASVMSGSSVLAETDGSGNPVNEYIYFDGMRIARRDSSGNVYYSFGNELGSPTITTATGSICYDADFFPFGGERAYTSTCAPNYKFAGMEQDASTALYRTLFRQYAANNGRWLSPDPYMGSYDPTNPQSFNRYSYVGNSPLANIDPLGLMADPNSGGQGSQAPGSSMEGCLLSLVSLSHNASAAAFFAAINNCDVGSEILGLNGFGPLNGPDGPGPHGNKPSAPNNGQTQQQKTQDCLNKVNNMPDGKIYNFFGGASYLTGADTTARDEAGAAAGGAMTFVNAGSKNMVGTPLGTASGATADVAATLVRDILVPVVIAATVAQIAEWAGCSVAP
jgi:RHS repeat-associated protein